MRILAALSPLLLILVTGACSRPFLRLKPRLPEARAYESTLPVQMGHSISLASQSLTHKEKMGFLRNPGPDGFEIPLGEILAEYAPRTLGPLFEEFPRFGRSDRARGNADYAMNLEITAFSLSGCRANLEVRAIVRDRTGREVASHRATVHGGWPDPAPSTGSFTRDAAMQSIQLSTAWAFEQALVQIARAMQSSGLAEEPPSPAGTPSLTSASKETRP